MHRHDVVVLSEIKLSKLPHVAGFVPIVAKTQKSSRGGLAVLIRSHLYQDLCHIDTSYNDQIWFSFTSIPDARFCGVYITPSTSPYFTEADIANIQAKTIDPKMNYVIVGDFNARLGKNVEKLCDTDPSISYNPVDKGVNDNGDKLISVCKDHHLVPVNNLVTELTAFTGALTFRKRNRWISELDLCVVSKNLIPCISYFAVNQDTSLPSNHAPISASITFPECRISLQEVVCRSDEIGKYPSKPEQLCRTPIKTDRIDCVLFMEKMNAYDPTHTMSERDPSKLAENFSNLLYATTSQCKTVHNPSLTSDDRASTRWERILNCSDDSLLWKAIDWKGQFNPVPHDLGSEPSETEFQNHLEELLNPGDDGMPALSETHITIPVLDSAIESKEVDDVICKQLKENRGCGPDGSSPGVFKLLPAQWVVFLCYMFNIIFVAGYPLVWTSAKLIMLFKKGLRIDCNNYRGISVINNIAKIYDYILNNRLMQWYKPCREQAGAQHERGCIEHIVTLRIIFSTFLQKKLKLYVVFVDFSKAYDKVPRRRLFDILIELGCGVTMLSALISMYSNTTNILGSTIITSTIGVRQGSPTSCYLFIIFVDVLILLLKSRCSNEPILGWLHSLMLMDDTILLATSREKIIEKVRLLHHYCEENGMKVNAAKTRLMVINGGPMDKIPIIMPNFVIKHCSQYVYLGAIFTADGRSDTSLQAHLDVKNKEVNKLLIFFATNYDAPFMVKKRVLEAAFMSSILYGCEAWLNTSLKQVEVMYMKAVKALLGVRITTPNKLCLIEGGLKPLTAIVKSRQKKFLDKMREKRGEMHDDPLIHALNIAEEHHKPMWKYIESIINGHDFVSVEETKIKESINTADPSATKFRTYHSLNPMLEVHPLYTKAAPTIPDYLRINFTRYRLSSHQLRVEVGRWSRTPADQRTCTCGLGVQNEQHIFECPIVEHIFNSSEKSYNTPEDIFDDTSLEDLQVLYQVLNHLYAEREETLSGL